VTTISDCDDITPFYEFWRDLASFPSGIALVVRGLWYCVVHCGSLNLLDFVIIYVDVRTYAGIKKRRLLFLDPGINTELSHKKVKGRV
jgi:hypothetical protein